MRPPNWMTSRPRTTAAGLTFVISLVAAAPISRTIIHPDEVGFLLNANRLLGGGPSRLPYFPGYSFFLVPVLAVAQSTEWLIRGAQLINGLLAACTAAMAVALLQRLRPELSSMRLVGLVSVAMLYPAFRLYGSLALSENALIPAGVGLLLLITWLAERPTAYRTAAVHLAAGSTLVIHPRAIGIAAGTVAASMVVLRSRANRLVALAALGVSGVLALVVARLILANDGRFGVGQSDRTSFAGLVGETLEVRSLVTLPLASLGQLTYLVVATLGLATVGALWVVRTIRSGRAVNEICFAAAVWLVPCFVFTLGVSSMFMNQGTGDRAIYGRYVEAVVLPLLLVGLIALNEGLSQLEQRIAVTVPAAGVLLLVATRGTDALDGREQLLNISGIVPIIEYAGSIDPLWMAVMGTIGALGLTALVDHPTSRLVALGLAFVTVSIVVQVRFVEAIDSLPDTDNLVSTVRSLEAVAPDDACVLLDEAGLSDPWSQQNFRLEYLDLDFRPFVIGEPVPACAQAVVTPDPEFHLVVPGSRLLDVEGGASLAVWILPVEDQERFFTPERPGVANPSFPLVETDPADLVLEVDSTITDDDTMVVTVEVTNISARPLVPAHGQITAIGAVAIGLEWRMPDSDERLAEPFRLQLDRVLYPGESTVVTREIPLTIDGEPLTGGEWQLRAELVQEGIRWIPSSSDTATITAPPPE